MSKVQKFKNYLKRNYKVLLGILLTISAYIGLMFLNRYLEKYCKEDLATSQPIISTRESNRKMSNSTDSTNVFTSMTGFGVSFYLETKFSSIEIESIQIDTSYYDYLYVLNGDYFEKIDSIDISNLTIYSTITSTDNGISLAYNNMPLCFDLTSYLFNNNYTDYVILDFGDITFNSVVCTGSSLNPCRTNAKYDTSINTPYLSALNDYDTNYSTSVTSFIAPLNIGLYSINFRYMAYQQKLNYGFKQISASGFTQEDVDNAYNEGYNAGELNSENYQNGYNTGYDLGYSEGYTEGVNNSVEPLLNFNDTSINSLYQTDVGSYGLLDTYEFPINGYTYNFTSDVSTAKEDRLVAEDYSDSGNMIIDIYNISDFSIKSLEFESVGFSKIEFLNDTNIVQSINIDDYRTLNKMSFDTNNLADEIKLYYNALEDVQEGYILNIYNKNDYQNGYQNGYNTGKNEGVIIGKNLVINNPNEYDLYTENQYLAYGNSQFSIGNSQACKLNNVFYAIADVPFIVFSSLLGFDLFGFSLFNALTSIITLLVILWLAKKLI